MIKRLITSSFLIFITTFALFIFPLYGLIILLLILGGLYEFYYMVEKKGVQLFKSFGMLVGGIIPLSFYFSFNLKEGFQFLFIILFIFLLFLLELSKKENHQPIFSISATIFGIFYISWCFSFFIKIRQLPEGLLLVSFLIITAKSSDIGAYIFGKKFGKVLLLEKVSPKKTLEGATGGIFTGIFLGFLFSFFYITTLNFWEKFFMVILIPIIAELGDLFESLIKRDCEVKDSGKIFPGMGGVLDVIDSLIFVAPIFYFYLTLMRR